MNVLITSAGRRVKVIQYFQNAFKSIGKVIAADCDYKAPALHYADQFEIIPKINETNYISTVLEICKKQNVKAIVSLLDPELEVLSKNLHVFERYDIKLIISPYEMIDMSFDKQKTYDYLTKLNIPAVPTYSDKDNFMYEVDSKYNFPVVIKPGKGSASIGLVIVNNESELNNKYKKDEGLIIQPYYKDREFGIDVYIDLISGELIDIFIKEKLLMRSGETDKSISVHNYHIEKLVKELIDKTSFRGPIDIDCFEYEGNYYISEINPRFGGGYPHAYELGCDFMSYISSNLRGNSNETYNTFNYDEDLIMMKYDDVRIIKE